jgi:hypothetical protein
MQTRVALPAESQWLLNGITAVGYSPCLLSLTRMSADNLGTKMNSQGF